MDEAHMIELKKKIKDLDVEDNVIFTGFTKDVNEHIKLCNTTVLATHKETFGLVVIESMINKVPVIATANGGPLEIIDEWENGLLFNRTSSDLVDKITLLYKDNELKTKFSVNGYKKVKKQFDKDTQMKKMYEVINES